MEPDDAGRVVDAMLRDVSRGTVSFGGVNFYGLSPEFHEVFQLCRDVVLSARAKFRKAYLFLDAQHGKTSIAKAADAEARFHGFASFRLDGTAGIARDNLRVLQAKRDAIVIIDDLPETAAHRRVLVERFNAFAGRALLLSRPEYCTDGNLDATVLSLRLSHIDERPIDKVAWIIGLIREQLLLNVDISLVVDDVLGKLPPELLCALTSASLGRRLRELPTLAASIAEALTLRFGLDPTQPFPSDELASIFVKFVAGEASEKDQRFRLWVEGSTDYRILKLVSRLVRAEKGVDLEEGLAILPLGEDRDGGTSRLSDVVLSRRTRRNRDLFLLDCDQPGLHAKEELDILEQDVLLLEPRLSCSRSDTDAEIEDFVSLACLDQFYEEHAELRPEKEIIRYKDPAGRRLIVSGVDKDALVTWLESHASLRDVESLFLVMSEIRERFSLRNVLSAKELRAWRKRLVDEVDSHKHVGNRPKHWA